MPKTKKKLNWIEACRLSKTGYATRKQGSMKIVVEENGSGYFSMKSGYSKMLCRCFWDEYVVGKTDFKPA